VTGIQSGFGYNGIISGNQLHTVIPANQGVIHVNNSYNVHVSGNNVIAGGNLSGFGRGILVENSSSCSVVGNRVSPPLVLATGTITGTTTLTLTAWTNRANRQLWNGMAVTGSGIPSFTVISNVTFDPTTSLATVTLSHASTNATGVAVSFNASLIGIYVGPCTACSIIGNHVDLSNCSTGRNIAINGGSNTSCAAIGNYASMGKSSSLDLAINTDIGFLAGNYVNDVQQFVGVEGIYDQYLTAYPTTGITAASTQGGYILTGGMNVVTTAINTTYGVTLPFAIAGTQVTVVNNTAAAINVWPASGGFINNGGSDAAFAITANSLTSGSCVIFTAISTTQWVTNG
jgi:hypothetical protein